MQFRIISKDILRECLSNLLTKNYKKSYNDFRKFVNLEISEEEFEKFKKRGITKKEINEIVKKTKIDSTNETERLEKIWNKREREIVGEMNKLTGLNINTKKIICYVDPYQKGGYYGDDDISVGIYKNPEDVLFVIAHELFHIFYWRKLKELSLTESVPGKEETWEWELAEVSVHALQTEPSMRKIWSTITIEIYPEIKKTFDRVKNIWKENSFKDFLVKSYNLLKNEQNKE